MRTIRVAALIALAIVGCTGNDATVVDEDAAGPSSSTVVVQEFAFQDPSIIVAPEAVVTWENRDDVAHTVTAGTPNEPTGAFDEELSAGGEVAIAMDEPGTFPYFCRIHPNMTAEIVVEPAVE